MYIYLCSSHGCLFRSILVLECHSGYSALALSTRENSSDELERREGSKVRESTSSVMS